MTPDAAEELAWRNVRIFAMDNELSSLAYQWFETKSLDVLAQYHILYYEMFELVGGEDIISPDAEIADGFPELPIPEQLVTKKWGGTPSFFRRWAW